MRTLVVAPHPDDELLGCGGTLLRRRSEGAVVGWLLVTAMVPSNNQRNIARIEARQKEIDQVRQGLGIAPKHLFQLGLPTTQLDELPLNDLVNRFSGIFTDFQPEELLLPHASDAHSDHRIVFDIASACTKWFRHPSIKRVMSYETVSETDFVLKPDARFLPTSYVDITPFIERKLELMRCYPTELDDHPFPRSETVLRAQAQLRGAQAGYKYAEAFQLLRERQ